MRSALAASSTLSAACHSGRSVAHVARATKRALSSSSASTSAVAVSPSTSSLDPFSLPLAPSSRLRSPVATRRRRLRPSSTHARGTPEGGGDGGAGGASESEESKASPSSSPQKGEKKAPPPASSKSASPLGDLMAMLLPVQKRKSGSKGPPPPTLPQRWRAIKGSARAATEQAWERALTLPVLSQIVAFLRALDVATSPAREAFTEWKLDVIDRYRTFRAEEVKRAWAWETRSKQQGKAWKSIVYNLTFFVLSIPYLVLAPANPVFSVAVPLAVGLSVFDRPILNPVILAWVLVGLVGKWNAGALANAVGLPVSALPRLVAGG